MATYGTRDATRFQINGVQYYTLIESSGPNKGQITIKSPTVAGNVGGVDLDRTVGVIPLDNTFRPTPGSTTTSENAYFSSASGQKEVKNKAVITAQRGGATNAQQLIFPNTALTSPQQPQQGGSSIPTATPPTAPQLPSPGEAAGQTEELTKIDVAGGRGSSGLRYPKKMSLEQDKIKFQACKISPRTESQGTGLQFEFAKPIYEPVDGSVVLAIQSAISDQNSVDWGPDNVNALDAALFEISKKFIYGEGQNEIQNALKGIYENAKTEGGRLQRFLAGQAASLNNVLARTDNVVLNPNLELLFQGPQLRPFTFQFKMSARSGPEANEIKKIIKYFKYHMAVRQETGLFLKAPHVFTIRYLKGETDNHPGINLISPSESEKACALTNCSVDYTPLGSYMTYEDGTMVAYTLNLQFQELTPIYDTDYTDAQSIGY
jgi:hypothetical protein